MAQRSMIALFVLAAVAGAASIPTAKPTQFALHPKFASARTNLREGHALLGGNVYTATTAQATAAHPKYYEAFLKFFDVLGQGHEIVEGAKSRLNKVLDISSETFYPTKSPTAWDGVSPTRSPTVAGGNPHTGGSGRANSIQSGSAAAPGTSLWTRPPTDSPTTSPTAIPATSCANLLLADSSLATGVHAILMDGTVTNVFCDMTTDGGGWMLLLTQTSTSDQYAGSVSPFTQSLNADSPSLITGYSRDWSGNLAPVSGDEFLMKSSAQGDWVRFVQENTWCGWDNGGNCHGSSSHLQFAHGKLYSSSGSELPGFTYFNGCAHEGGGLATGSDGVGFGKYASWLDGPSGCYGGCWNNVDTRFYWSSSNSAPLGGVLTYWHRPAPTAP